MNSIDFAEKSDEIVSIKISKSMPKIIVVVANVNEAIWEASCRIYVEDWCIWPKSTVSATAKFAMKKAWACSKNDEIFRTPPLLSWYVHAKWNADLNHHRSSSGDDPYSLKLHTPFPWELSLINCWDQLVWECEILILKFRISDMPLGWKSKNLVVIVVKSSSTVPSELQVQVKNLDVLCAIIEGYLS